jgi:hypothetical protein
MDREVAGVQAPPPLPGGGGRGAAVLFDFDFDAARPRVQQVKNWSVQENGYFEL